MSAQPISADVVIIGSGMGGGTTAHALARQGVDVMVLERGERLPREPENWSPRAVFAERRYRREGGTCIRCATCDGFPCKLGAKSDAETCGIDPALATGHARLLTGVRVRRLMTDRTGRRIDRLVAEGPDGAVEVTGGKFVL